ncbi:TOG array regulator of axonemal microtubules protein 1 [Collichthys lucidus]|uniref:TOG array regulator of axonemal microtubules protein 1 n=1 Tax=Collichthys lucidus TaxID=240159 RepID=A0A4U5V1Z3_COLLU|nr:TOG array regulator of axonemal microtubules protein 1 [Collichthys lucidus]
MDWAPTVNLGYESGGTELKSSSSVRRDEKMKQKEDLQSRLECAGTMLDLQQIREASTSDWNHTDESDEQDGYHRSDGTTKDAAMDTLLYLYVYLQKNMDNQAEDRPCSAAENCTGKCKRLHTAAGQLGPGGYGEKLHLSAAVRASTAQQLRLLAETMGADAVLSVGKTFTTRFVTAVCKMSLDAAAEVRPHGHAILHQLAIHPDFMEMWNHTISEKDRPTLTRILRTAQRM